MCTLVAQGERVAPLQAALINGTTSHMLDYDDVNLSLNGHPTAAALWGPLIGPLVAVVSFVCSVGNVPLRNGRK